MDSINASFLDRTKKLDQLEFGEDRTSEKRVVTTSFGNETTVSEVDKILGSLTLPSFGRPDDRQLPEAAVTSAVSKAAGDNMTYKVQNTATEEKLEFRRQDKRRSKSIPMEPSRHVLHPTYAMNSVFVCTNNDPVSSTRASNTKLKIDTGFDLPATSEVTWADETNSFTAATFDHTANTVSFNAANTPSDKICREPSGVSTTASPFLRSDASPPMVIALGENSSRAASDTEATSVHSGLETGKIDEENWIHAHRQQIERKLEEQANLDYETKRRNQKRAQVGPPVVFVEGCGQQPGQCVAWRLKVIYYLNFDFDFSPTFVSSTNALRIVSPLMERGFTFNFSI